MQVPSGEVLTFGDDNFIKLEEAGVREAKNAAFVLVAGGLGERLGYKGIKVKFNSNPPKITLWMCFYVFVLVAVGPSCRNHYWKMFPPTIH